MLLGVVGMAVGSVDRGTTLVDAIEEVVIDLAGVESSADPHPVATSEHTARSETGTKLQDTTHLPRPQHSARDTAAVVPDDPSRVGCAASEIDQPLVAW